MVVLLGRPQIDLIDFVMGKLFILAIKSCADQWVEQCRRDGSPPWAPEQWRGRCPTWKWQVPTFLRFLRV